MKARFASHVVLSTLLTLAAVLPMQAKTTTTTVPSISFRLADQATIHQHDGAIPVAVTFSDSAGLRMGTVSGGYSSAVVSYTDAPKTATASIWFFASYFPVGDYTFHATVLNVNGQKADRQITLHLVP